MTDFFIINVVFVPFIFQRVYVVSFGKPGYIEVPPVSLNPGTEITLSFSTKNESGVILIGNGGNFVSPRRKRRQSGQVIY